MSIGVGTPAAGFLREYERCAAATVDRHADPDPDRFPDPGTLLAARLPVAALAFGAVAAFADAADRVRVARGLPVSVAPLHADRIAASFCGDRMLRLDGEPVSGFAELSGFFAAADGWVRTHANYPHHRARLLTVLGLPEDADRSAAVRAIAGHGADDLEHAAALGGALVVRVRTPEQWRTEDAGRAGSAQPLVRVHTRPTPAPARRPAPCDTDASVPLRGLRVLDLTRVIAGPVATRSLALLGADVLRIDPPQSAELAAQTADTCQGKRTSVLDLHSLPNSAVFADLVADADVLVTGYRPGALEPLLSPDRLGVGSTAPRVHARVTAWGDDGPWARRRGFDSLVQAASGIAAIEADAQGRPGALPAQALDHASGYLLAAAVLDALLAGERDGLGRAVSVSLAGTASWLLHAPGRRSAPPPATLPGPATTVTHDRFTTARPALADHDDYPWPAHTWGADDARWPTAT
ncbi:CoA transferase [Speluncibacter jeojiensis]|uniref:CoA transferase n=1 Tax=Speluncibacter jeojiensis TaxID=2710754 RepID=A0A9X4M0Y2_9ACTN|nr:CoA transferase [Corynebacteriales bacterium D3-21]